MEENFRDVFVLVSGGDALGFMGFRRKMSAVRRVAVPTQKEAFVIWALSVRGVGESATSEEEPTQDKACNLGRFLDSLRSLGMTYRQVVPFIHTGCIRRIPGTAHRPFPTVSLVGGSINHTGYIRNVAGVKPFIHTGSIRNAAGTASALFWAFTPKNQICNRTGEIVCVSLAFCQYLCYAVTGATSTPAGGSPGLFRG